LALRADSPVRRALKHGLFALWLLRLRLQRIPVVRTVHNETPHEAGRAVERRQLSWFDALTVTWIRMNETTRPRPGRSVHIPHGHYAGWFSRYEVPAPVPGRLLYFGLIRAYKGVPELLAAFTAMERPQATLRIVGNAQEPDLRREVERAAARDGRINAEMSYVDDATLAAEIGAAQLVVLPFQRLLNSGTVLLALSLGRPVLIPAGPTQQALADEFGSAWVQSYSAPLGPADLAASLDATAGRVEERPDLSRREWSEIGAATYGEYVTALAQRRRYSA
jgi:beta-1,4-mannosyltransferase